MSEKRSSPGETVEMRVRLSPDAYAALKRYVMRSDPLNRTTLAATAGRILTEVIALRLKLSKEIDFNDGPLPAGDMKHPAESIRLFMAGYTINQIAAITKKPYAQIANEIGMSADHLAQREPAPDSEQHARNILNGDI